MGKGNRGLSPLNPPLSKSFIMKKGTKILFPTDFSEPSVNAFRYALVLADKIGATIELLNVVYPQGESLDYPMLVAQTTKQQVDLSREKLKTFVNTGMTQVLSQLKNAPGVQPDIEVGTPVNTICQIAERDDIDLIVIGSRGTNRSALDKLMGSVAAGVVSKAHCPVLVVPEDSHFKGFTEVAYASDTLEADPFEIWKAMNLIKPAFPIVHCIHFNINDVNSSATHEKLEKLEAFYAEKAPGIQVKYHHLPGEELTTDLNEFVDTYDIDLLIMYKPPHNFWDRLFHKSATKRMAIHTHIPLLVMTE